MTVYEMFKNKLGIDEYLMKFGYHTKIEFFLDVDGHKYYKYCDNMYDFNHTIFDNFEDDDFAKNLFAAITNQSYDVACHTLTKYDTTEYVDVPTKYYLKTEHKVKVCFELIFVKKI